MVELGTSDLNMAPIDLIFSSGKTLRKLSRLARSSHLLFIGVPLKAHRKWLRRAQTALALKVVPTRIS